MSSFGSILTLTLLRYFCKIFEKYILLKVITGSCLSLRCLIFKVLLCHSSSDLSLSATCLSYHIQFRLSRVFLNFFAPLFQSAGITQVRPYPESRCSSLFHPLDSRHLVRQLCYNTTFISLCQHLFSNFFITLQIVYLYAAVSSEIYCQTPRLYF